MWPTHCVQQMVAALLHASYEAISPERHLGGNIAVVNGAEEIRPPGLELAGAELREDTLHLYSA